MRRKFDGKYYDFYGSYHKKSRAQKMARGFRAGGELARVVRGDDEWLLYVRYGHGRGYR